MTELTQGCNSAVLSLARGSSTSLDEHGFYDTAEQPASLSEALHSLEDTLSQRQYPKAVQLLRATRKQWKEVELGSLEEEDDVDCLFFIYARYVSDRQEGKESQR